MLFHERELALQLAWRAIRSRTKQSFLGLFWPLTQPVAGALIYFLVFNQLAGISSGEVPYPLFAFVGATAWAYTNSAIGGGTASIAMNAGVVSRTYLPRITLPFAACLGSLLGLGISLLVVFLLMAVYRRPPTLAILTLPLWVLLLMALALGVSSLLSVLNARSRDVAQALAYFLQAWQYGSPVGYPSDVIPEQWRTLYYLNPLAGILDGFRWSLLGGELTQLTLVSLASTAVVLGVGFIVFGRLERTVADYL